MTKMQAIETCAKAMVMRRGCDPAAWFQYPENTELAANIVTALEALGLLQTHYLQAPGELQAMSSIEVFRQEPDLNA